MQTFRRADESEPFERFFQSAVDQVGVDLGRGDVAVAEGALDDEQVAGGAVEVSRERVAKAMWGERLLNVSLCQPVSEPVGDLPR